MPDLVTWAVTFDGAEARLFQCVRAEKRLVPIKHETGPHRPPFDDRKGRVHESTGTSRSAVEPKHDPERALENEFVERLCNNLTKSAQAGEFDALIVAAGPRALGAFRQVAPKQLRDLVIREFDSDYASSADSSAFANRIFAEG